MGDYPSSKLFYFGTNDEVLLGDRVEVRGWILRYKGHVSYIPGISPKHDSLEYDDIKQWAITADDGTVYAMGYYPAQLQPSKKIKLLERGSAKLIQPEDPLE